jgi:hypothetical protein
MLHRGASNRDLREKQDVFFKHSKEEWAFQAQQSMTKAGGLEHNTARDLKVVGMIGA